jgi:hypothetical protein
MLPEVRSLSISVKASVVVLAGVVFLPVIALGQVKNNQPQTSITGAAKPGSLPGDIPLCNGPSSGSSAGNAPSRVNPHPHSVTLSWKAAVPASNSPRDAIKGYYVYRSFTSSKYAEGSRISESLLPGTQCVDTTVKPRKTYFYVVKAVTEAGKQSDSSIEIKAVIPSP